MALDRDTTFTWYGHACVEVRTPGGKVILIDPWFGNPKSPRSAESVDRCDLMLVTHGHGDHMGEAVSIASRTRPPGRRSTSARSGSARTAPPPTGSSG